MKEVAKKSLYSLLPIGISCFVFLDSASAEVSHFLCEERNRVTMIGLMTEEYHVAICKNGYDGTYYYAGQSRADSTQSIFLPVFDVNNPYTGANPWLLKARNGQYTYQVAEFNPLQVNSFVSVSVFRNGERIYHRITDSYIRADE